LDAGLGLGEGAKRCQLCDPGGHILADLEALRYLRPRLTAEPLQAQCDLLALAVDAEDQDFDLVAHLHDLAGVADGRPRQLGEMDQTIGTAEIDEGAKVGNAADPARPDLALLEILHQPVAPAPA